MNRKNELIRQAQEHIRRHWETMPYRDKVLCHQAQGALRQLPAPRTAAAVAILLEVK